MLKITGGASIRGVTIALAGATPATSTNWFSVFADASVGTVSAYAEGIAYDSSGNIIVIGGTSAGNGSAFVTKYDTIGTVVWQQKIEDTGGAYVSGEGVSIDASGDVYVIVNTITGAPVYTGNVLKLSGADGSVIWQKVCGDSAVAVSFTSIFVDNLFARLYVVSDSFGANSDAISEIICLGAGDGKVAWQFEIAVSGTHISANGVTVDSSGNIYVSGDTTLVNAYSTPTGFLLKLYTDGSILWQRSLEGSSSPSLGSTDTSIRSCITDSGNNVYTVGYRNLGGGATPPWYLVLTKFDSAGTKVWDTQIEYSSGHLAGLDVAVDSSGNIYANAMVQVDATPTKWFIAKFNSSGAIQWQRYVSNATRDISAFYSYGFGCLDVSGSKISMVGTSTTTDTFIASSLALVVPTDGTLTGTYNGYVYAASSLTQSSGVMIFGTSPGITVSAASNLSVTGGSNAISANTYVNTLTNIL